MLSTATKAGRSHRVLQQNCQDAAFAGNPQPGFAFGIVLDGCGGKVYENGRVSPSHNEVGARLLGQYAAAFLDSRLREVGASTAVPSEVLRAVTDELHAGCIDFMSLLVDSVPFSGPRERARFIGSYMLTTMVGFVIVPASAAFFWSGDGYYCRGDQVRRIDRGNRPDYLAYRLLGEVSQPHDAQGGFDVEIVEDPIDVGWLAVATDGWHHASLREAEKPRPGLSLQRWVNQIARQRGLFEDDAAIAAWWRPTASSKAGPSHELNMNERQEHQ